MQSILSPRLGIYHLHFLLYFKVSHKADRFKEYEISPTPQRKELKSYLKEHDSQKGGELESFVMNILYLYMFVWIFVFCQSKSF